MESRSLRLSLNYLEMFTCCIFFVVFYGFNYSFDKTRFLASLISKIALIYFLRRYEHDLDILKPQGSD